MLHIISTVLEIHNELENLRSLALMIMMSKNFIEFF